MNSRRKHLCRLVPWLPLAAALTAAGAPEPPAFDPTDRYEVRQVEGWTVLVNKAFLADEPGTLARRP